ncbi:MAG: OmpH family outer membrane protein [Endozoicomonadaceae bacterium]|nr:OmpH family outer membrane protein [Endozoicomonadaceae bacterium]
MLRHIQYAVFAMVLAAPLVNAETSGRIGVVNSQMAMLESVAAKQYAQISEKQFGEQIKKLKRLESQYKALSAQLEKDGLTMSEAGRAKVQLEMRRKKEDWDYQANQVKAEKAEADHAELAKLQPQLEEAIQAVAKSEGYDLVFERAAARFVQPDNDLTLKVIDKMNRLIASQK